MEFKLKASSVIEIKNDIIQSLNSLNENELISLNNFLQNRNVIHIKEDDSNGNSVKLKRKSNQIEKIKTLNNRKRKYHKKVNVTKNIVKKKNEKNKKNKRRLDKDVKTISIKKKAKITKKVIPIKRSQKIQLGMKKNNIKDLKKDIPIILLN